MKQTLLNLFDKLESAAVVRAIRSGLVMAIPVLMIGSFALIFRSLPIPAYQSFLTSFLDGDLVDVFNFIFNATFGLLSVYMTFFISICYARTQSDKAPFVYGAPICALICYGILSGVAGENFSVETLGVKGMFTAIFCAVIASILYTKLVQKLRFPLKLYADGVDVDFNRSISVIFPALFVAALFAAFNYLIVSVFHVSGFQELFINTANNFFQNMGRSLPSGLAFVFISSFLWFFGIHGSDVLEGVADHLFVPALELNQQALASGGVATEIFSKTFFDVFILVGGCGSALCLLIAVLVFSKRRSNKSLGKMALFPMLFNINELLVFGLPVVFNPFMFIPFILTPIVVLLTSYTAMSLGWVPVVSGNVEWTTPVLLGGYLATGSLRGSILQLFNLLLGILIYKPFVDLYDREKILSSRRQLSELVEMLKQSEESNLPVRLTELQDVRGVIAKTIAADLPHAMEHGQVRIFYQPQFNSDGVCCGAEALLRWEHELFGMLYPPLVVKVAEETNFLYELDTYILTQVVNDLPKLKPKMNERFKLCVNVTAPTIKNPAFEKLLAQLLLEGRVAAGDLCLEITEQMELFFDEKLEGSFGRIRAMGYGMAIDDFSMGHTSLKYLQSNQFSLVKLDGSLVRSLGDNAGTRDIIDSIIYLSQSMGFEVLAECVETEEQQHRLIDVGCRQYQGYLFSQALPLAEFLDFAGQNPIN